VLQAAALNGENQDTIPSDTSMTNNPGIPTESVTKQPRRGKRRSWLRYLIPSRQLLPELAAEGTGTFLLLQMALGIVLPAVFTPQAMPGGVFPIALLTGAAITTACAALSSKCAAHFNPAITWAMCCFRQFGWHKFAPYVVVQLLGAAAAAAVNYGIYASTIAAYEARHGFVRTSLSAGGLQTAKAMACFFTDPIGPLTAFYAETFGTFLLTTIVFSLTSERNTVVRGLFIPPIIGATVAMIITIVGPISCASLNPARELGPRLVLRLFGWSSQVAFHQVGVYLGAAMLGATLGGVFVDEFLYADNGTTKDPDDDMRKFQLKES
jgi:MIP family channel proteins